MTEDDAGSRRAKVILVTLCMIAAGTIAGVAIYRYAFWGDQLPGGFAASPADHDGDGMPEYLITKSAVEVPESGDYGATATLSVPGTGTVIATTGGHVELDRGTNVFGAGFWGPAIRDSQTSGPYLVKLTFVRQQSDELFEPAASADMVGRVYTFTYATAAYDWRTFQEQPAAISVGTPTSAKTDADSDGRFDAYEISVPLVVHQAGLYAVRVASSDLSLQGVTDRFGQPSDPCGNGLGLEYLNLQTGTTTARAGLPAEQVYLSGVDGTIEYRVTVSSTKESNDFFGCRGLVEQPAYAAPPDGADFGLRTPYVLPPTPLGLKAETSFADEVHWYDFESPPMPIEFTGAVRDYGTDADADGLYDALTLEADVIVHQLGTYDLSGTLYTEGAAPSSVALLRSVPKMESVVTTAWTRLTLQDWSYVGDVQTVRLDFAGAEILRGGEDGPFQAKLRIVPAHVYIDPIVVHTTEAYTLSEFEDVGAKEARLGGVDIAPQGEGVFVINVDTAGIDCSYTVLVRIVHANGIVSVDTSFSACRSETVTFATDGDRAKDFAVAVYLQGPYNNGVDYLELPLAT